MTQSNIYRQIAFEHHGKACSDCGAVEGIEVHHKDRDRSNNEPENLEPLCHECHMERHHEERVERMTGPRKNDLDNYDPGKNVDQAILDVLRDGRVIVPYLEHETGYSKEYIRSRLTRLIEHGHVQKVYRGLYELSDDPRE